MIEIENIHINNVIGKVVRFEEFEFYQIKKFILKQCKELKDSSFFITNDIDSELPLLLKRGYGLVYGIVIENKIVAVQAIDYNIDGKIDFLKAHKICNNNNFIEVGWAMVAQQYRKIKLATYLSKLLEQHTYQEIGNKICVATVHPKNTDSILLFFRLGYIGIELTFHFNVIRLIMIKKVNSFISFDLNQKSIIVRNDNFRQQEVLFDSGYFCTNVQIQENETAFFVFSKGQTDDGMSV